MPDTPHDPRDPDDVDVADMVSKRRSPARSELEHEGEAPPADEGGAPRGAEPA